jgi:hypothetical protein
VPGTRERGDLARLLGEVAALTRSNRRRREVEVERRLLRLRHLAGLLLTAASEDEPEGPTPAFELLPGGSRPPEVAPSEVTPELVRAAILRDGCLLVRGLVAPDPALGLADEIERIFALDKPAAAAQASGESDLEAFEPEPPLDLTDQRRWVGSVADSGPPTARGSCSGYSSCSSAR